MFERLFKEQKFSFRHIKNLATHSEGLSSMIEKLRIRRPENELKIQKGRAVIYHPLGKTSNLEDRDDNS